MRVVVLPSDATGCGTLRCAWPAMAVQEARPDWQVELYEPGAVKISYDYVNDRVTAVTGLDPRGIDVVVMQRVGRPSLLAFARWLQDRGTAVAVDADDALWAISRDNIAWGSWNGKPEHWRVMQAAAEMADLVTVTTPGLAQKYGRHGRVEMIPNRLPKAVSSLEPVRSERPEHPVFGWSGSVGTHPHDLQVSSAAAQWAEDVLSWQPHIARVVGAVGGAAEAWGIEPGKVDYVGPKPITEYHQALSLIDVGLVPLESSAFNRCKSSLKALEFSAAGVPVVASPTPANRELAKSIPIALAGSDSEWVREVSRLMTNANLRDEVGARARAAASDDRWTVEGSVQGWINAWERAANRRARMAA